MTANQDLSAALADNGARMTPVSFEKKMVDWFKANGRRMATFAGSEEEAKQMLAGLFYAAARVPRLLECTTQSLGDCLMQSAQLGLYPGAMQQCAYLPFNDRKKGVTVAQFAPMYQGLVKLAFNTRQIRSIQSDVVYEGDEFEFEKGTNKYLRHKPFLGPDEERGKPIAVYCVIESLSGAQFEVKSTAWVEGIRKKSARGSSDDSPWNTNWEEMARKSIFKQARKWIPSDSKLAQAIEIDNSIERPDLQKPALLEFETAALAIEGPKHSEPVAALPG